MQIITDADKWVTLVNFQWHDIALYQKLKMDCGRRSQWLKALH